MLHNSQEIAQRAEVIYEQRLQEELEHSNPDEFVAIEPDSGDHLIGPTLSDAIQAARKAHPDRLSYALRIGHRNAVHLGESR